MPFINIKHIQKRVFYNFVKASFYPSAVLAGLKIFYLLLFSKLYGVLFLETPIGIVYNDFDKFIFVNSISNILVFATLMLGLFYQIIKAFFLHDVHISPKLSAFLYAQNLERFITTSVTLYTNIFAWLLFSYLMVFLILFQAILRYENFIVFFVSLFFVIVATVVVIVDLEKDHEILKAFKKYV